MPNLSREPGVNVHIRSRPLVGTLEIVIHRRRENRLPLSVAFLHQPVPRFLNDVNLELPQ
jgi:hypothetical protein